MRSKIKLLRSRLNIVKIVLSWFVFSTVFNYEYRGKTLAIILFQLLGNTILASSIISVIFIIQNYNKSVLIPVFEYNIIISQYFFSLMALIFSLILIGSYLIFWSRSNAIYLSLAFEVLFSKKITTSLGIVPLSISQGKQSFSRTVSAFNLSNSKHKVETARALRIFLQITNPMVVFIYSFIAMSFINPLINLILVTIIILFTPLYYWAAIRAVKGAVGVVEYRSQANVFWRDNVRKLQNSFDIIDLNDDRLKFIYDAPVFSASLRAVAERLTAPIFSQFFANVGLAIAFIGTTILIVSDNDFTVSSINTIILTAILLQLILTSFRSIIQSATSIMRLFPSIQSCHQSWISDFQNSRTSPDIKSITVRYQNNKKSAVFKLGEKFLVCLDANIQRYNIGSFLFFLSGKDQSKLADWIPNVFLVQTHKSGKNDLSKPFHYETAIASEYEHHSIELLKEYISSTRDKNFTFKLTEHNGVTYWTTKSVDQYAIFNILRGIAEGKKILVIESDIYLRLVQNHQIFLKKTLKDAVVIIVKSSLNIHNKIRGIDHYFSMSDEGVNYLHDADFHSFSAYQSNFRQYDDVIDDDDDDEVG